MSDMTLSSRIRQPVGYALFLLGLVMIAVAANSFARLDGARVMYDATKTRAYSLSHQTQNLMSGLTGEWIVAVILSDRNVERSTRKQLQEVLNRFRDASSSVSILQINPEDPASLEKFDVLLARLQEVYGAKAQDYVDALDQGEDAFRELQLFAQQQTLKLEQFLSHISPDDPLRSEIQQGFALLSVLADQGQLVLDEISKARKVSDARPIPDYETARSILAEALSQWGLELDSMADLFSRWYSQSASDLPVRIRASSTADDFATLSQQLAEAADPLKRLPVLELSAIGRQLEQGEAAVVIGPQRAALIPSHQLFPKLNLVQKADGGVVFDQRFRGEQVIAAAIRSLTVKHLPHVVFVHADDESLLRPRERQTDLVGVSTILASSRFGISEWRVSADSNRPRFSEDHPSVWVVVPPAQRAGIEPTANELKLISAVKDLLHDGENVLLSVHPSLIARYGQIDPWTTLTAEFGFSIDTSKVVFESSMTSDGAQDIQRGLALHEYTREHSIARAVNGLQTYFALPVGIQLQDVTNTGVHHLVIATISPSANRWLDSDWARDLTTRNEQDVADRITQPVPIVVAGQRPSPLGKGDQRLIAVGSGGWFLSYIADVVVPIGGERVTLVNPGNYELFLASVAWLAGLDELIASSPLSQEVSRLEGITPQVRARFFWIIAIGLPGVCLAFGFIVAGVRRY